LAESRLKTKRRKRFKNDELGDQFESNCRRRLKRSVGMELGLNLEPQGAAATTSARS
jgi:hypothetical protein